MKKIKVPKLDKLGMSLKNTYIFEYDHPNNDTQFNPGWVFDYDSEQDVIFTWYLN